MKSTPRSEKVSSYFPQNKDDKFFILNIFYILFIFGCAGSSLLRRLFSSCGQQGYSLVVVCRLPLAVASLLQGMACGFQ